MKSRKNLSPNGYKGKRPATEFDDKLDPRGKTEKRPATAFNAELDPHGKTGKRLTILSIDGGGVRGIIPAKILKVLEDELKELEMPGNTGEHYLCEYFDLIAGTSSGGLITAMITTPKVNDPEVPTCNASEVVKFFEDDAVGIFPETFKDAGSLGLLSEAFASVFGPIYSADKLKGLLEDKFGQALLSNAFTSVIIPAFDTENEVPVFFSNLKGVDSAEPLYNVQVKDACRATTAVPIFFPPAKFKENQNQSGRPIKEFNVIDGGIAVNDPTLVAVTQEIVEKRRAIAKEQSPEIDFSNVLVLSLGTGQHPMHFVAKPHWSSVDWLLNPSGFPLVSSFIAANGDMVEYYTSMIFDAHKSGHHYLRIQTDCLPASEFWEIDDATKRNLEKLKKTADKLLKGPVSKRNFATGKLDAITGGGSNKQALRRFARWLVEERRERQRHQAKVDSRNGKSSRNGELPRKSGSRRRLSPCDETQRDGIAPSTAGAVQTVVNWCCLMTITAVGRCCSMMRTAILVVVHFAVYIFMLCMVWLLNL